MMVCEVSDWPELGAHAMPEQRCEAFLCLTVSSTRLVWTDISSCVLQQGRAFFMLTSAHVLHRVCFRK